jgi:hypothetical protein
MKDPIERTLPIPCPQCANPSSHAIYRHFDLVSLMCGKCEHTWSTDVIAHPSLKKLPPFRV